MFGFSDSSIEFQTHVPFSALSTVKLGGYCQTVAYPKNEKSFVLLLNFLNRNGISYRVVGCLSNTLPCDGEYEPILISTRKMRSIRFGDNDVTVSCGARPLAIAKEGIRCGLSSLLEIASIPGTIGAGIRGNAEVFGLSFSDFFISATVYDIETETLFTVTHKEMDFSYRYSILKDRPLILIHATFRVYPSDILSMEKMLTENRNKRRSLQPYQLPSLGSVFLRNEKGESVAYFIDQAGMKGKTVGGVCVSKKHAGFIVNQGNGTATDYKDLIFCVQKEIKSRFGWIPKCEIDFL